MAASAQDEESRVLSRALLCGAEQRRPLVCRADVTGDELQGRHDRPEVISRRLMAIAFSSQLYRFSSFSG